jgi:putative ABC transport system permease protein
VKTVDVKTMKSWLRRLFIRFRSSFSHARQDHELDAEISSHLDFAIEENIKRGMSPEEARRQALVRFGGVEQAKQHQRDARGLPAPEILWQDLRYAVRTLRRDRSFALLSILILALGIGATTAMFSIIRAVLLKPLAFQDPGRIVLLSKGITPVRFDEMKSASRSYDGLGVYAGALEHFAFSGMGEPEVLNGARVSGNFLQILGVDPLRGRSFLPQEDTPGAPAVVMISAEFWQRRFNRDPRAIGKSITLGGAPYTIIGVLPPSFQFPFSDADVWVTKPSEASTIDPQSRPLSPTLGMFGRLKPGVDIHQAEAELATLKRQYAVAHPGMLDAKLDQPESLQRLKEKVVSDVRPKLWLLMGAVSLVLLIVCANIGSLLLARATSRSHEFAVRAAIGAGRSRLIKQLLAESLLLASIGGALGVTLAVLSLNAIRSITFVDLPRAGEIHMDGNVLGFAIALTILTGVLFGLVPSLIASRPNLSDVLKGSGEITSAVRSKPIYSRKEKRSSWFAPRGILVVGQVALSVVLLIGASLLIESLAHLYRVDPGFEPAHVLTMHISLPPARYDTSAKCIEFYDQLIQRTEALPGVRSAARSTTLPMTGWMGIPVQLAAGPSVKLNQRPITILQLISAEYFSTMGIPLKRGRVFNAHDNASSAPVAIINETFARRFWPQYPNGPDPIGQSIEMGAHHLMKEIVGITADVREDGRDRALMPGLYLPASQWSNGPAAFIVRTDGDPLAAVNAIRGQVHALDRQLPVTDVKTLQEVVEAPQGQLRLMMQLLGAFAFVATLLAIIGICGVISYSVVRRTKEIGIRCALGAQRRNIISLVIGQGFILSIFGVFVGIGAAFGLTRVLRDFLFQVRPADPLTFTGISILFVLVAVAASYIPAHKAIKIDPMVALRTE